MAADVSSLVRLINGVDSKDSSASSAGNGNSTATPVTMDLLGGSCSLRSKELDLDVQVPIGWEKRLDLKSGKVYLQRNNSPPNSSSSNSETKSQITKACADLQDLNFPPVSKPTLNLFDDSALDLKLVSSSSASPPSATYQSVCTLDKVRSALERAEKETSKKRSASISKSSSSRSNSSSSIKDSETDREEVSGSFAAGCPRCLMYVLVLKSNPKCPRCNIDVPLPVVSVKKPRLDLNMAI